MEVRDPYRAHNDISKTIRKCTIKWSAIDSARILRMLSELLGRTKELRTYCLLIGYRYGF